MTMCNTAGVQATSMDALGGKLSAVVAGYYEDPYMGWLRPYERKAPLINRGNYTRVAAARMSVAEAAKLYNVPNSPTFQIVNIGAGHDTLWWFVRDVLKWRNVKMFEVDHGGVLRNRATIHQSVGPLWKRLQTELEPASAAKVQQFIDCQSDVLAMSRDWLWVAADLCETAALEKKLSEIAGLDPSLPTLFIAECVLVYLERPQAEKLIEWMRSFCTGPVALHIYQPLAIEGSFATQMARNLAARGCPLLSPSKSPQRAAEELQKGWDVVTAVDLNGVYDRFVDRYEQLRVQRLELLDELEEFCLLQAHYVCVAASKNGLECVGRLWAPEREQQHTQRRFSTAEIREHLARGSADELRRLADEAAPGELSKLMLPSVYEDRVWQIPINSVLLKASTRALANNRI